MLELDDPGLRPRFGVANRNHLRRGAQRIAMKNGLREDNVCHPEIGHGRAERGVINGHVDHDAQRIKTVEDALPEFRRCGEMGIDMQRLRIQRQQTEHRIVHFGDGSGKRVLELLPDLEILEI